MINLENALKPGYFFTSIEESIPYEIMSLILSKLTVRELPQAFLVHKNWNALKNNILNIKTCFFGFRKSPEEAEQHLKELLKEIKNLTQKALIPERLIVYLDQEKKKVCYESTLFNCKNLRQSEIVRMLAALDFYQKKGSPIREDIHPLFLEYLHSLPIHKMDKGNCNERLMESSMTQSVTFSSFLGLEILMACGGDINMQRQRTQDSFLIIAIKSKQYEMAKFLLKNSADRNHVGEINKTALDHATEQNATEIIELLKTQSAKEESNLP